MITVDGQNLTIEKVVRVARSGEKVRLDPNARKQVEKSVSLIDTFIATDQIVYGITTGFGHFGNVVISKDHVRELQKNLLMSHATGTGPMISPDQVRAMMVLRINALIKGYSGIRWKTLQRIVDFLNQDILPIVPQKGSVGASGDLVPLAHMALPLIGMGKVVYQGKIMPSSAALKKKGLSPLILEAKEGLALINGTQMMTAVGVLNLYDSQVLCRIADIAAACSVEALRGTDVPFDPKIHRIRPHPGQKSVSANMRKLLKGSQIQLSHKECDKVQDAYSLRCIPQVHGATRDTVRYVHSVLLTEMNSVTDNPLIFPDTEESISCGNFHGQPCALVLDYLAIAMSELANISERRIERLVDPSLSNLPPFLTKDGGLNSGYMITQYTAAALVSENKVLSHPASVDSIPTSANQEDHVSMGTISAFKAAEIIKNVRSVLAIEILCAAQGLDFIKESPGNGIKAVHKTIRQLVPSLSHDRVMSDDLRKVEGLITSESLLKSAESKTGRLI